MRILVVDDNPVFRAMLAEMILGLGHEVLGEEETLAGTLKAYHQGRPDVVTLDLSLEKEDGLTVLASLRRLDHKVKVLIISANTQDKVREAHLRAGAAGFLAKPFNIGDLEAALSRFCHP